MQLMEPSLSVIVLIQFQQLKARVQLSADLFFQGVGKLHPAVVCLQLAHLLQRGGELLRDATA